MTDGPEKTRFMERMFGNPNRKLKNFNVLWGDEARDLSEEQRYKVLNDSFDRMEHCRSSRAPSSGVKSRPVREILAEMGIA